MKRSELKRTKPLVRTSSPREAKARPKKCKACRGPFFPLRPLQIACSPLCAQAHVAKIAEGQAKDKRRTEAKADRAKAEALKTVPDLKREAQQAFNAFIRERDRLAGHPCISSGRPLDWGSVGVRGHSVDAGHYRSTGSADHLRFDERNCHAQSVRENRDRAGNAVAYRLGLIQRIGLAAVEALEADNAPRKWTRDELRQIRDGYRAKLKALKARAN